MDMFVAKLQRDGSNPRIAVVRLPLELLARAGIDPLAEVVLRAEHGRIQIEPIQEDTEQMEIYAEEFVADYTEALKALGDDRCPRID